MYSDLYYDRLNAAFAEYIDAMTDCSVSYSRVLELRTVYESILHEPYDVTL
jgi:hypothetical protein